VRSESVLVSRIRELSRPLAPVRTGEQPVLRPIEGVRAVLFDVYGTMLISGSGDVGTSATAIDSAVLAADALGDAGFALLSRDAGRRAADLCEETIRAVHEERKAGGAEFPEVDITSVWRHVLDRLRAESAIAGAVAESAVRGMAIEYECRTNPTWPMPGLPDVLAQLHARGIPLGIVSNSQFYTPLLFDALLGRPLQALGFEPELCVWSFEVLEGKPSRRLYAKAADTLRDSHGITPEETLFVGNDMLNDVWAATQTGFRTVLFAGDKRSLRWREDDARCTDLAPDAVITDLCQLLSVV